MKPNTEWFLILAACRAALGASLSEEVLDVNIDGKVFLSMVHRHKVNALVYKGITDLNIVDQLPKDVIFALQSKASSTVVYNLGLLRETVRLSKIFEQGNLQLRTYKGIMLSKIGFGDYGLREMSDIDILIKLEDFKAIEILLLNDGYEHQYNVSSWMNRLYMYFNCEKNFDKFEGRKRLFHVEPHWSVGTRSKGCYITENDLTPFHKKYTLDNQVINSYDTTGLLITTCLHHGGQSRFEILKEITDIAALLKTEEIDWDRCISFCLEKQVLNIVTYGVYCASYLYNITFPQKLNFHLSEKLIKLSKLHCDTLSDFKRNSKTIAIERLLFQLNLRKDLITKVKIAWHSFLFYACFRLFFRKKDKRYYPELLGNSLANNSI